MSIVRWDPFRDLEEVQRSLNRLMDPRSHADLRMGIMPVDVYETSTEVVVRADLPGVQAEDIQVQHHDGQLFIRATRGETLPADATWLLHQAPEGELTRGLTIGVPVDLGAVHATYDAGVLEVRLPKSEHARPRAIPVRALASSSRAVGGRRRAGGDDAARSEDTPAQ